MLPSRTLQNLLTKAGSITLSVSGKSMLPTLDAGDKVRIEPVPFADVALGDIISFFQDGRYFVHRVKSRVGLGLLTCGDNNVLLDVLVVEKDYLGRITAKVKPDGTEWELQNEGRHGCALEEQSTTLLLEQRSLSRLEVINPKHLVAKPIKEAVWCQPPSRIIGINPQGIYSEETLVSWLLENPVVSVIQTSFRLPENGLIPTTRVRGVVRLGIYDWEPHQCHPKLLVAYLDGLMGGVLHGRYRAQS